MKSEKRKTKNEKQTVKYEEQKQKPKGKWAMQKESKIEKQQSIHGSEKRKEIRLKEKRHRFYDYIQIKNRKPKIETQQPTSKKYTK